MEHETLGLSADAKAIIASLQAHQDEWRRETDNRLDRLWNELMAVSAAVKTGFPGGDFDGHRRYHELLIAKEEQRAQIRREVITHLLKASTWAVIVGLGLMLLRSAKDYFK